MSPQSRLIHETSKSVNAITLQSSARHGSRELDATRRKLDAKPRLFRIQHLSSSIRLLRLFTQETLYSEELYKMHSKFWSIFLLASIPSPEWLHLTFLRERRKGKNSCSSYKREPCSLGESCGRRSVGARFLPLRSVFRKLVGIPVSSWVCFACHSLGWIRLSRDPSAEEVFVLSVYVCVCVRAHACVCS